MGAPAWTAKEISALEEMTAKYPLPTVARKLNRSVSAVFLKQQRLGIGGLRQNSDMITRNTLSKILGVENRTIKSWEAKGLKSIKKKPYIMYRHRDIINYMRDHLEDWNAARITDDSLFMRFGWYHTKYNWTEREESKLKFLRHEGYTIREIAEKMNRSESSIKYKLYRRN